MQPGEMTPVLIPLNPRVRQSAVNVFCSTQEYRLPCRVDPALRVTALDFTSFVAEQLPTLTRRSVDEFFALRGIRLDFRSRLRPYLPARWFLSRPLWSAAD